MAQPGRLIVFSLGVGLLSGAIAMGTKSVLDPMVAKGLVTTTGAFVVPLIFAWGIAAVSLIGLQLGAGDIQKVPVWHCQAVLSALAFLLFGSLGAAALAGVLAGLLQELMARTVWNHGSSHVDPPAGAIALGTLLLNLAHGFIK
jgi:Na+-driven multidrug efflux pump